MCPSRISEQHICYRETWKDVSSAGKKKLVGCKKKEVKALVGPGPQLDILKKLTSEFLEVDGSMLHTGYACRSCYDSASEAKLTNRRDSLKFKMYIYIYV